MPRTIASLVHRDVPLLRQDMQVQEAIRHVMDARLPALPVVDAEDRYAGIFGEREFITALFPGYVKNLGYAAFVPKSVEAAIEKRQACRFEPVKRHMNNEHVDVRSDFSDLQLAEIFIHHRVLVVPITENERVCGLVTRSHFFGALAERFIEHG